MQGTVSAHYISKRPSRDTRFHKLGAVTNESVYVGERLKVLSRCFHFQIKPSSEVWKVV